MAFCLMLSLTAFSSSAMFTSFAYLFYFPLLAGLCTAFRHAVEAENPRAAPSLERTAASHENPARNRANTGSAQPPYFRVKGGARRGHFRGTRWDHAANARWR
jgi:hypothetical protein